MDFAWSDNLESRIAAKPDLWFAKIKAATAAEESAAKLAAMKETATEDAVCELADMVATLFDAVFELSTLIAG